MSCAASAMDERRAAESQTRMGAMLTKDEGRKEGARVGREKSWRASVRKVRLRGRVSREGQRTKVGRKYG